MRVKFWGTRGSIPVPGRDTNIYGGNTTCLEMTLQSGATVIIDAGTGIRPLGEQMMTRGGDITVHLLMTHIHWDHILGFPFFAPIYTPATTILFDGFPTCKRGLRVPFDDHIVDGFFPVKFADLKSDIRFLDILRNGPLTIDGVLIDRIPLQHPQGGYGFRFHEDKKTLVFLTDNELTEEAWEGRRPEDYIRFCEGADILIHDAQFTPEERKIRKGWGHSDYLSAVDLAVRAGVRRLILFHHDPPRKDRELTEIRAHCEAVIKERKIDMVIETAVEGSEFVL